MMKNFIAISTILIFSLFCKNLYAQSDRYDWSFKFGWGIPSFVNFGDTKDWIEKGRGNEVLLGSLGYKNVNINFSGKFFNGLISENTNVFEGYQFPQNAEYRKVFMNLTLSYEHELINRLFIDPQIGWVRAIVSSDVIDIHGKLIDMNSANGLVIGTNLTKYIKLSKKTYLGFFVNANYNFINYRSISKDLGGNTLGYGFGFLLKGTN
jgi:hypothetical protein